MLGNLHEWLGLLLRWSHLIAGIMWIGTSFYFVWLDSSFKSPPQPEKGVDGETYMVHGGNFYHVKKRKFGPGEIPNPLHWFIWEATFTWITGFLLLIVVYYLTKGVYLVDKQVYDMSPARGAAIGLAYIFGGWLFYDALFRSLLAKYKAVNLVALGLVGAVIYSLTHLFSGRAAFLHVGAMFGTMMVLNVWVHILPNQRAIINAANAGKEPDYSLGVKAKRRSMHNSYMTLPVLFIMVSNHFPSTYGHTLNWLVLILLIFFGALIRHFMITLHKWPLVPAIASLCALIFLTAAPRRNAVAQTSTNTSTSATANATPVSFYQANHVIQLRCVQCHSAFPTDDEITIAPNDVRYDRPEDIKQWSERIYQRAFVEQTMPLNNKTGITPEERELIAQWIREGAKLP